jgi:hypothetical protein
MSYAVVHPQPGDHIGVASPDIGPQHKDVLAANANPARKGIAQVRARAGGFAI